MSVYKRHSNQHPPLSPGTKIGRWTVLEGPLRVEFKSCHPWGYRLQCDCGTERTITYSNLRSGKSLSCGCGRPAILTHKNSTHGQSNTRLYVIWSAMKRRCLTPTDGLYQNYGGRGIVLAEEWKEFVPFYKWATTHGYKDDLTIDRIDGNGNYEPNNCRWATYREQANNLRSNHTVECFGERKSIAEWSRDPRVKLHERTILSRLRRGWTDEQSLTRKPNTFRLPSRPYRTKRRLAEDAARIAKLRPSQLELKLDEG